MAKGKKTGGRDFKPGHPGNPNGRPRVPEDLKRAREMSREEVERIIHKYLRMNREELSAASKDPKASTFELMLISIINKAVVGGDQNRLDFILNRAIGKVTDKVENTHLFDQIKEAERLSRLSDEELDREIEMERAARKTKEAVK